MTRMIAEHVVNIPYREAQLLGRLARLRSLRVDGAPVALIERERERVREALAALGYREAD